MVLKRIKADQDITLGIYNRETAKNLDPCLPNLFMPAHIASLVVPVNASRGAKSASCTDYYDEVLATLLDNLRDRKDPDLQLLGSVRLLERVLEVEPNCDKRLATQIYDHLRFRIEEQFEPLFLDLSTKENAVLAMQECESVISGYDEFKLLALKVN